MSLPPPAPVPVLVPDLGTAGSPLTISNWFVEPGDSVLAGDALVEVLVPGITCDIAAPVSGRLDRLTKDVEAAVQAGDILAWIIPEAAPAEPDEQ